MKNIHLSLSLSAKYNFVWPKVIALFFFLMPAMTYAQIQDCGTVVPASWNQALIEQAEAAYNAANGTSSSTPSIVPVRFTQALRPVQFGTLSMVSQTQADAAIAQLNAKFSGSNLTFQQCGPINYLLDTKVGGIGYSFNINRYVPFEYTSGAMEVYLASTSTGAFAPIPCPAAYQSGNPVYDGVACPSIQNFVYMQSATDLAQSLFLHETGHHLGLMHTHHGGTVVYNNPPTATQIDRPYLDLSNPLNPDPADDPIWFGRELVIRKEVSTNTFKQPNVLSAGDFVEDTPADCASFPGLFPGCPITAQNSSTCEFDSTLTYKDYNNDFIFPAPVGLSLGRNFMSYWKGTCVNQFTPGQMNRANFIYNGYVKPAYGECESLVDDVSYRSSEIKLPNVSVRLDYYFSEKNGKTNVTTKADGIFNSIGFDGPVYSDVYHNGKLLTFKYDIPDKRVHFDHEYCEWTDGVTEQDLYLIGQNANQNIPFTSGYEFIAADANKSGLVTMFDVVLLRRLLKGTITTLPNQDQIFRFVPEFIPADYKIGFNTNPFLMDIPAISSSTFDCSLLAEATNRTSGNLSAYGYSLPNIENKRGFDAIKIGDVDGDWSPSSEPCVMAAKNPDVVLNIVPSTTSLNAGDEAMIRFKADNFSQATAMGLGLRLAPTQFEILGIESNTLSDLDATESFGLEEAADGKIRVVWFESNTINRTLTNNTNLFSIKVRAKQAITDFGMYLKLDESVKHSKVWRTGQTDNASIGVVLERLTGGRSNNEAITYNSTIECLPNPNSGIFQMRFNNYTNLNTGRLRIFNVEGQLIQDQEISLLPGLNETKVDALVNMPNGHYQILVQMGDISLTTKIIRN